MHLLTTSRALIRLSQLIVNRHRQGEDVYAAMGRTKAGRYLVVFFVHKADQRILILTARDMTIAERRRYGKKQQQKKQHLQGQNVRCDGRLLGYA